MATAGWLKLGTRKSPRWYELGTSSQVMSIIEPAGNGRPWWRVWVRTWDDARLPGGYLVEIAASRTVAEAKAFLRGTVVL